MCVCSFMFVHEYVLSQEDNLTLSGFVPQTPPLCTPPPTRTPEMVSYCPETYQTGYNGPLANLGIHRVPWDCKGMQATPGSSENQSIGPPGLQGRCFTNRSLSLAHRWTVLFVEAFEHTKGLLHVTNSSFPADLDPPHCSCFTL